MPELLAVTTSSGGKLVNEDEIRPNSLIKPDTKSVHNKSARKLYNFPVPVNSGLSGFSQKARTFKELSHLHQNLTFLAPLK